MSAPNHAQVDTAHRDPVRDEARAIAVRALTSHSGVIRSMSAQQRREVVAMDAGPAREVGLPRR